MRLIVALIVLAATPALAQTPLTGTTGAPTAAPAPAMAAPGAAASGADMPAHPGHMGRHMTMQERFDAANTTHDGMLTHEQARAHLPAVARDFEAIDADHDGTVTVDEIKAYRHARRAAHKPATPE